MHEVPLKASATLHASCTGENQEIQHRVHLLTCTVVRLERYLWGTAREERGGEQRRALLPLALPRMRPHVRSQEVIPRERLAARLADM